ncbi:hormone-sensitive lipase-like, partial [Colius striatus]|uniref:hormone-sensitive lipase-like n=1 Tax=Colius striatus TaxID=57412 RepID=UPI002B1DF3EA
MDLTPLLHSLHASAQDNGLYFQHGASADVGRKRLASAFTTLARLSLLLRHPLRSLSLSCHLYDLDEASQGNGYRSLVLVAQRCLAQALGSSKAVAARRRSVFFRPGHKAAELEAYCAALTQIKALLGLAGRILERNPPGSLFPAEGEEGEDLSQMVLREYSTMSNGCFYGRCIGFQFAPSLRPLLQAITIGLVSFGQSHGPGQPGLGSAAGSLLSGGLLALDPELRGAEFERVTQNLDVGFWKRFWNLTETQLLA